MKLMGLGRGNREEIVLSNLTSMVFGINLSVFTELHSLSLASMTGYFNILDSFKGSSLLPFKCQGFQDSVFSSCFCLIHIFPLHEGFYDASFP